METEFTYDELRELFKGLESKLEKMRAALWDAQ